MIEASRRKSTIAAAALAGVALIGLTACGGDDGSGGGAGPVVAEPTPAPSPAPTPTASPTPAPTTTVVSQRTIATFDNPWAMTFLPSGGLLVTEKPGRLYLVAASGTKTAVTGLPAVVSSGQIGLQDVVLDPGFATNNRIWLSYAEAAGSGWRWRAPCWSRGPRRGSMR